MDIVAASHLVAAFAWGAVFGFVLDRYILRFIVGRYVRARRRRH